MILVIIGAGASYDSVPHRRPKEWPREKLPERPPLAQELFYDLPIVDRALKKFPQCHAIVPILRIRSKTTTIENTLEILQAESDTDVVRQRQLAAIRFYLQHVIAEFEKNWQQFHNGITNYRSLLDQLRRSRRQDEPVCIVTFNYDRLIESALEREGVTIKLIDDYIANPVFKLFKLHGSVDWGRPVVAPFDSVSRGREQSDVIRELIESAEHIQLSSDVQIISKQPASMLASVPVFFPAIAIPVEKKSEFVCPESHVKHLKELLRDTRIIMTIGWRGAEDDFNRLLHENLPPPDPSKILRVCAVAETSDNAKEALSRSWLDRLTAQHNRYSEGFSGFIEKRDAEKFCRDRF
jgi:SIR2-like domain